jgi:hypothetical protein
MTYRDIWERACAEGKGGMEDGRPWVESGYHNASLCPYSCHACRVPDPERCNQCSYSEPGGHDFFWPSSEPLPEVDKP